MLDIWVERKTDIEQVELTALPAACHRSWQRCVQVCICQRKQRDSQGSYFLLLSVCLFSRFAVEVSKFNTFFWIHFSLLALISCCCQVNLHLVFTFSLLLMNDFELAGLRGVQWNVQKQLSMDRVHRRGMRAYRACIRHCFSGSTEEMWRGMERSSAPGWKFCSDTALSALLAVI